MAPKGRSSLLADNKQGVEPAIDGGDTSRETRQTSTAKDELETLLTPLNAMLTRIRYIVETIKKHAVERGEFTHMGFYSSFGGADVVDRTIEVPHQVGGLV